MTKEITRPDNGNQWHLGYELNTCHDFEFLGKSLAGGHWKVIFHKKFSQVILGFFLARQYLLITFSGPLIYIVGSVKKMEYIVNACTEMN